MNFHYQLENEFDSIRGLMAVSKHIIPWNVFSLMYYIRRQFLRFVHFWSNLFFTNIFIILKVSYIHKIFYIIALFWRKNFALVCRSCIVRYLEESKFCPVCDVQVHKVDPFMGIKPDKLLQNLLYMVVPNLHKSEFYLIV